MAYPAKWRSKVTSGNLDTLVAGTTTGGAAISTAGIAEGTLSCLATVDGETDGITIAFKWQVSDDNSTWYDFSNLTNTASTVMVTGTAGADAAVSTVFEAPAGALGWKFVRAAVVNGVATGAATDTYSLTVKWRAFTGFESLA